MQCFLCHSKEIREFFDLGMQPLANKYPTPEECANEDFFPLKMLFCTDCKNVQLGHMVSRERLFTDYYYLSSVNQGLVRHFDALSASLANARFVVDIGSNDGILLKPLLANAVRCVGVEPSVNVSKIANDLNLPTINTFFNTQAVDRILSEYEAPDVIVASSIFTHLEDPHTFLDDMGRLLADDGQCIIEVEYIANIIALVQFERFYFDRIFYYSLSSLTALCAAHGMVITDAEMIEPHGGSLRVTVKKQTAGNAIPSERMTQLLRDEQERLTLSSLTAFKAASDTHVHALREMLVAYKAEGLKVAGYGAPARVATTCNYGSIGPDLVTFIVDDSPLKQNRLSPGTHIPIRPKAHLDAEGADVLLVFAYEYFDDIKKKTNGAYRYLFPIPPREVT